MFKGKEKLGKGQGEMNEGQRKKNGNKIFIKIYPVQVNIPYETCFL